jgi:hypothetical protein
VSDQIEPTTQDVGLGRTEVPITAHTYLKRWETSSKPVLLRCDDGNDHVVKGANTGRMLVNDRIVAKLGTLMGAPVPTPEIVHVPPALIAAEPRIAHITPGPAHGSRLIDNCRDGGIEVTSENQDRFAQLAILFGLATAQDHQFLYADASPHEVYSADHGHFFPQGPG